jgi:hypothetical protein
VGGTTTSCEGEWNSRNDGRGRVSWKYWEVLERQKKAILLQFWALVNAFLRVAAVFLQAMLDWEWGKEIAGRWLYLTSFNDFIYLFGCLTRGSWLPPLKHQTQVRPFSHSH